MKVMISMPMNGRKEEDIKRERDKIIEKFKKLHIEVVDTLFNEDVPEGEYYKPTLYYMAKSIDAIGKVDAVYFAKGWSYARGCLIERDICRSYGVKILDPDFIDIEEEEDE